MDLNLTTQFYLYKPLLLDEHKEWLKSYAQQQVWIPACNKLNDPFESNFIFHSNSTNGNNTSNIMDEVFNEHGVLCLASKNNNLLMWSHYASGHSGYCLEFELDFTKIAKITGLSEQQANEYLHDLKKGDELLSFFWEDLRFIFGKVIYANIPPKIYKETVLKLQQADQYTKNKHLLYNSLLVKSSEWKYEEEYRLIINQNSYRSKEMKPIEEIEKDSGLFCLNSLDFLKITGIITGINTQQKDKDNVHSLCKQHNLNLYEARKSKEKYEISIDKISSRKRCQGRVKRAEGKPLQREGDPSLE